MAADARNCVSPGPLLADSAETATGEVSKSEHTKHKRNVTRILCR